MRVCALISLVITLPACREDRASPAPPVPFDCDESASAPAPAPGWWNHETPCPAGTRLERWSRDRKTELACVDRQGGLEGSWAILDMEGRAEMTGTHREGLRHGEFIGYFEGVRVSKTAFCEGLRHGRTTSWAPASGRIKEEGAYVGNEEEGVWRRWHENGQLAWIGGYRQGLEHGVFEQWDASGRSLGRFTVMKGTGPWKQWHDNGTIAQEGWLRDGKPVGRWITRTLHGSIVSEDDYPE